MRKVLALLRISWLSAASYRLALLFSLVGLLATAVPLFFVTNAMQPLMADAIRDQGANYFGFVIVGLIATFWVSIAVNSLPDQLGGMVRSGTFEALLSTPTPLPVLVAGLASYGYAFTLLRSLVLLGAGALLGAVVHWTALPAALLILVLLVLAYLPFGLVAAAMQLVFRTAGPFLTGVTSLSFLLGGVYYPTHVIPSWIRSLAEIIPLAPALVALRRVLLDGASLADVAGDLGRLVLMAAVLLAVTFPIFLAALRHARREGTLAQY